MGKEPFGSFLMLKITQNLLKMPDMCVGDAQKDKRGVVFHTLLC